MEDLCIKTYMPFLLLFFSCMCARYLRPKYTLAVINSLTSYNVDSCASTLTPTLNHKYIKIVEVLNGVMVGKDPLQELLSQI